MDCSHCYCEKQPATTNKPTHLLCCKCGKRMLVSDAMLPEQHRLYQTWEEERQFREAKERYGLKDSTG